LVHRGCLFPVSSHGRKNEWTPLASGTSPIQLSQASIPTYEFEGEGEKNIQSRDTI
jgi:hypothetical protein